MSYPLDPLLAALAAQADPDEARAMSAYMRDRFPFYGVKRPMRGTLLKAHLKAYGQPKPAELEAVVLTLWARPERECQYLAMAFIEKQLKKLPPATVDLLEHLIVTKSWWDTVDMLISYAGHIFARHPGSQDAHLPRWREADDIWLRRAAILFQRGYKTDTDFPLLAEIIRENLGSDEFFINKAIGWALREYSKVAPQTVIDYVAQTELAPLSSREALKWLKSKGQLP